MIGLSKYVGIISNKLPNFSASRVNSPPLHDIEEEIRDRVCNAGSEALVFNQLALRAPTGKGLFSLHIRMQALAKASHFGSLRKRRIELKHLEGWN